MKTATSQMRTLLATAGQLVYADLYTFTLVDGSVFLFTDADQPVVVGGLTYWHGTPMIERGALKSETGLVIDSVEITIKALKSDVMDGGPILTDIAQGKFDGAGIKIARVYSAKWGDWSAGSVVLFIGNVSDITEVGRTHAKLDCKSLAEKLNILMPRHVYQPSCHWTLFDEGCTLNKATSSVLGATVAGGNVLTFATSLVNPDGSFTLGTITFTSGPNAGLTRTVRLHTLTAGQITLWDPLPVAPGVDAFTIAPGCNKTFSRCGDFGNTAHFSGTRFVPIPEAAV